PGAPGRDLSGGPAGPPASPPKAEPAEPPPPPPKAEPAEPAKPPEPKPEPKPVAAEETTVHIPEKPKPPQPPKPEAKPPEPKPEAKPPQPPKPQAKAQEPARSPEPPKPEAKKPDPPKPPPPKPPAPPTTTAPTPGSPRRRHDPTPPRPPAAAAAGTLRERAPRGPDRVRLRGEWRAGGRMRTRRGVAALVVLAVALGGASLAAAVVTGQIFGPGSESFPIAVVPLKNLGGDTGGELGTRFSQVLSRDLDLSGYFRLLDPKTFIENPQTSGITAGEIDFVGWASLGAQALVKGGVTTGGDTVTVEVRLFDVPGRHDVPQVSRRYSGPRADLPRMAHRT